MLLFALLLAAAAVAATIAIRRLLLTPLSPAIEHPEPLRRMVPWQNLVFYTGALAWWLGATRRLYEPVKLLVAILRRRNAAPVFADVDTRYETYRQVGQVQLTMKVDTPRGSSSGSSSGSPCLLFFHGGGYALSSPRLYHHLTGRLASELRVPVLSPDYRKSPRWPYPAALDDAVAAIQWLVANSGRLGVDSSKVIVAGDSGGGHLAISSHLRLRQSAEHARSFAPAAMLLIYPAVQMLSSSLPSYSANRDDPFLSATATDAFRLAFVAGDTKDLRAWSSNGQSTWAIREEFADKFRLPLLRTRGSAAHDSGGVGWAVRKYRFVYDDFLLSPLFAPERLLTTFPDTFVQVCSCDILLDEGRMFHERLLRAGVPARLREYPSVHGMYSHVPTGHRPALAALQDILHFCQEQLRNMR